uniref:Uncharacterized protein n=1 Tax=Acrobeloides nanus TaxID=290746 RepID=A0A914DMH7_9BILA
MYMNPYFAYGLGNNMMGGMGGMNGGMGGMNGGMGFSNYGSAGMGNRLGQRYSGANRLGNNLNNNAHLSHVSCRYGACTRSNNRAEK